MSLKNLKLFSEAITLSNKIGIDSYKGCIHFNFCLKMIIEYLILYK